MDTEGNYIVDERLSDYSWFNDYGIETFAREIWLEPVVEIDGEWSLTEENDGFETDYTVYAYEDIQSGLWAVEYYIDQNSIEPVGYFYEQHDGNETDHGNDGNESDYGYNDENMSDDNGIPVFYLSIANLMILSL